MMYLELACVAGLGQLRHFVSDTEKRIRNWWLGRNETRNGYLFRGKLRPIALFVFVFAFCFFDLFSFSRGLKDRNPSSHKLVVK